MIYTEITPNPATLKFVADKIILPKGSADFPEVGDTTPGTLPAALYELPFVTGVFLSANFISVTKNAETAWETAIPEIKKSIKGYFDTGKAALMDMTPYEFSPDAVVDVEEDETVRRIKQLLDENIRPAVAMDGGDVIFDSFDEGTVRLKLQGACSGCPSSTQTLKMGIEGLLTRMVPEVQSVEAVDA